MRKFSSFFIDLGRMLETKCEIYMMVIKTFSQYLKLDFWEYIFRKWRDILIYIFVSHLFYVFIYLLFYRADYLLDRHKILMEAKWVPYSGQMTKIFWCLPYSCHMNYISLPWKFCIDRVILETEKVKSL